MEHIIGQIIMGLIVGVIAKLLMPGRDPGGCIITILLGIAGSALFGWIARTYFPQVGLLGHWIGAILGAIALLVAYRLIFGEPKV
jgi:uncharacterized membrane protein YeaQ/YmgE (transglycosylase-associated protein family)